MERYNEFQLRLRIGLFGPARQLASGYPIHVKGGSGLAEFDSKTTCIPTALADQQSREHHHRNCHH